MNETLTPGLHGEWIEVTREIAGGGSCEYTDDCPCCECGEDTAIRLVVTRMRWSRSRKTHLPESRVFLLCMAHMGEQYPF